MKTSDDKLIFQKNGRRLFLKKMGRFTFFGSVLCSTSISLQASDLKKIKKSTGYRETQHIRDYYQTL